MKEHPNSNWVKFDLTFITFIIKLISSYSKKKKKKEKMYHVFHKFFFFHYLDPRSKGNMIVQFRNILHIKSYIITDYFSYNAFSIRCAAVWSNSTFTILPPPSFTDLIPCSWFNNITLPFYFSSIPFLTVIRILSRWSSLSSRSSHFLMWT